MFFRRTSLLIGNSRAETGSNRTVSTTKYLKHLADFACAHPRVRTSYRTRNASLLFFICLASDLVDRIREMVRMMMSVGFQQHLYRHAKVSRRLSYIGTCLNQPGCCCVAQDVGRGVVERPASCAAFFIAVLTDKTDRLLNSTKCWTDGSGRCQRRRCASSLDGSRTVGWRLFVFAAPICSR